MKTTKCFVFTMVDSDSSIKIIKVFSFNKQGYEYACKYLLNYAKECLKDNEYNEYTWHNTLNFNVENDKIAPSFDEFINCYKDAIIFSNGGDDTCYFCLSVIEMNVFQENLDIE